LYLPLFLVLTPLLTRVEGERNGVDQGVHNVLLWRNQLSSVHICQIADGPVAHVQSMHKAVLKVSLDHIHLPRFRVSSANVQYFRFNTIDDALPDLGDPILCLQSLR
jgi:hypothetical protein